MDAKGNISIANFCNCLDQAKQLFYIKYYKDGDGKHSIPKM